MMSKESDYSQGGFTLIELSLTLLIGMIISAAVYTAYLAQSRVHRTQDAVAEMQQNIRAAMTVLVRDLRIAGYDPTHKADSGFVDGVNFSNGSGDTENVSTSATQISFTADLDEDGEIDLTAEDINGDGNVDIAEMEQISYRLNGTTLERYSTTTGAVKWQPIAEMIDQIEFRYLDADGNAVTNSADLDDIVEVQVSILARTDRVDKKFTNSVTYTAGSGASWAVNDNFRRRLLITSVNCRNLGL